MLLEIFIAPLSRFYNLMKLLVNVMQKMVKKLGTTEDAMQVQDRL
jgi:hypothetical protein